MLKPLRNALHVTNQWNAHYISNNFIRVQNHTMPQRRSYGVTTNGDDKDAVGKKFAYFEKVPCKLGCCIGIFERNIKKTLYTWK